MDKDISIEQLINEDVYLTSYKPEWQCDFSYEKARLEQVLPVSNSTIEHIGSTAIPGMLAKPIVDIMIGIPQYPPEASLVEALTSLGYSFYGEAGVLERLYFTRRGTKNYNLAVVLLNGVHWKYNIAFREYLRSHPEECREYEKIKMDAITAKNKQLLSYSKYKKPFIEYVFKNLL